MTASWRRGAAVVAVGLLTLLAVAPVGAAGGKDPRAEQERVRRERANVARQLDVLKANDSQVTAALGALDAQVGHQQAALAGAQADVAAAQRAVLAAAAQEQATAAKMTQLQASMRDAAVQEYITGGAESDLASLLTTDVKDLGALAFGRRVLRHQVTDVAADIADQLESAREDYEHAREEAEAAKASADAKVASVAARLGQLRDARSQQAAFASEIDRRIEARLAEAANLASLDRTIAAQIVQQQQELARRAAAIRRSSPIRSSPSSGSTNLVTVRGITVAASIGGALRSLLEAADADGFSLGGGGYRSPRDQQRLREAHCPDPESSPPASCRPPTARPGSSMHERGLAIDFTSNGHLIQSRRDPAYRWLASNAGSFGFKNLPSEPWHWSTNGD